jgi:hypothetical protein
MIIECDTCAVRGDACGDCVVAVFLGTPPVLGGAEQRAIAVLAESGLVPPLRLVAPGAVASGAVDSGLGDDGGDPGVTDDTPDRSTRAV